MVWNSYEDKTCNAVKDDVVRPLPITRCTPDREEMARRPTRLSKANTTFASDDAHLSFDPYLMLHRLV